MGKRGPQPGNGGRPKKPLADKVLEGNPGRRPLEVIAFPAADLRGEDMPPPHQYLSERQKGGKDLHAVEIYTETWAWLQQHKCETAISAQVLERYAMSAARWIQYKEAVSAYGWLFEQASHHRSADPVALHGYEPVVHEAGQQPVEPNLPGGAGKLRRGFRGPEPPG